MLTRIIRNPSTHLPRINYIHLPHNPFRFIRQSQEKIQTNNKIKKTLPSMVTHSSVIHSSIPPVTFIAKNLNLPLKDPASFSSKIEVKKQNEHFVIQVKEKEEDKEDLYTAKRVDVELDVDENFELVKEEISNTIDKDFKHESYEKRSEKIKNVLVIYKKELNELKNEKVKKNKSHSRICFNVSNKIKNDIVKSVVKSVQEQHNDKSSDEQQKMIDSICAKLESVES